MNEHICRDTLKGRHNVSHLQSTLNVRCLALMSEAGKEQAGNCLLDNSTVNIFPYAADRSEGRGNRERQRTARMCEEVTLELGVYPHKKK